MTCTAKHTKYQPPDEAWKCSGCARGPQDNPPGIVVDNPDENAAADCPLLHEYDEMRCYSCEYCCSGAAFARRLQKAASMVPCEHCKGSGLVKRS